MQKRRLGPRVVQRTLGKEMCVCKTVRVLAIYNTNRPSVKHKLSQWLLLVAEQRCKSSKGATCVSQIHISRLNLSG